MRTGKLTVNSRLGTRKISRSCWLRLSRSAAASNCATATAYGLSTSGSLIATTSSPLDSWPTLAWGKRSTVASSRQRRQWRSPGPTDAAIVHEHLRTDTLHGQVTGQEYCAPDNPPSSATDRTRQPGDRACTTRPAAASP